MSIQASFIPSLRLATAEDKNLPAYDYTLLSAVNTCPTWGLLRYELGKSMPNPGRPLALEMGAMLHEAFAAIRMTQLAIDQGLRDHATVHMSALWNPIICSDLQSIWYNSEPERMKFEAAMCVMRAFPWEDDPRDKRRTRVNAEEAIISYLSNWPETRHQRVWVADKQNPLSPIGIEIRFDLVLSFEVDNNSLAALSPPEICISNRTEHGATVSFRFIGRIDGLHEHGESNQFLYAHENKSAGRLDDAWRQSYQISHQITGYCAAATLFSGVPVLRAYAIGLQIPQPKDYFNGVVWEPVHRAAHNFERWMVWMLHTVSTIWHWAPDPKSAPKYSHSCNRYFRPCSFIPFCYADPDEQDLIMTELIDDKWSPLRDLINKAGD